MTAPGDGSPNSAQSRDRRKRQGVFYTPEPVALYMAAATLHRWRASGQSLTTPRVVDPACGEGALLWPAYQLLCDHAAATDGDARLDIIRRQLFGVDLDPLAVETLRQRFRIELTGCVSHPELESVLTTNFRVGNAVAGHGWETPQSENTAFHWSQAFPEIAAACGFDIVLANPPYRRERGAKLDRAGLDDAPLTACWRQARMDLWHYFFHRGLDLLRPGGLLTFIVNSYWTTSHAGRPLIERLIAEATPLEFVLLDTAPVFPGVSGRHLIMQLRKGLTHEPCDLYQLKSAFHSTVTNDTVWTRLLADRSQSALGTAESPFHHQQVARTELLHDGRIWLSLQSRRSVSSPQRGSSGRTLGDLFEVRQGIAENPPRVTRQQALDDPTYRTGEGVFVLTAEELHGLNLSVTELACVRPYYSTGEITRDWSPAEPAQWLLYLNRETAPDLQALPNIARHLGRFRSLLERRREAQQGKIAWWHLHWPRESRLFEQPRILAVQMCRTPVFAYVERPTYVGFSTNLIVQRHAGGLTLPGLAALLNSHFAQGWFSANAKRRGVNLDITGTTLKSFPIPEFQPADTDTLAQWHHERKNAEIDDLVDRLYECR